MSDQEIIAEIRAGRRTASLKVLYKEWPKINALILKSGGSAELAQEIFNDSLLLLIEKLEDPNFILTSKLTSYLYGIARFLCLNQLKKEQKSIELEWSETLILNATDIGYEEEKEQQLKLLDKLLNTISEQCQKLFKLFYFEKLSMKAIADMLQYSSVNSAKTQKYKCLERANKLSVQLIN